MDKLSKIFAEIERKHKIRILYACETGSRAWGFPSPDSDYDVRFIYMHEPDWYVSLNEQKDTIEFMEGDWDITGWELRKSLLMLKKSNAALIERFQSPMVYKDKTGFRTDFKKLVDMHYNPVSVFYHYHSLCNNFWDDMKDAQEVKLKSLMYVVRSMLCCVWTLKDVETLPMEIKPLMKYASENIKQRINELIVLKAGKNESYLHPMDELLHGWINETMEMLEERKSEVRIQSADMKNLNEFFLKMWHGSNNNR